MSIEISSFLTHLDNLVSFLITGKNDQAKEELQLMGEMLNADENGQQPLNNLQTFVNQYIDGSRFVAALAHGTLELQPPEDPARKNHLIAQYKQLHSDLRHFSWQMQQISRGDLKQKVSFLGDFSISFNTMIEALREKKRLEEQIREQNEQLQQLIREKDKIFSIIGHDLKSPFNAIVGFSQLLTMQVQENDLDGILEYAEQIQLASDRAINLLVNLLDWARSQTGQMSYNPERIDLISLLSEVVQLLTPSAEQKNILIVTQIPDTLPALVDKAMISTVIRNLVSNAIKFTSSGGIITLKAISGVNEVTVSVTDTGVGIPPEVTCKLFGFEGSRSTPGTNNEQGTGLGLILCREFVEKHNGTIRVDSVPNQGSTFSFTLPVIYEQAKFFI
jgi:signal transduction histidine kinase